MDAIHLRLPLSFIVSNIPLSWSDLSFAWKRELISAQTAIDFATGKVEQGDSSELCLEVAAASADDQIGPMLEGLADESITTEALQSRWLYVILRWVYERREQLRDPLGAVEQIYDDWGYPAEIASFVRYMPAIEPVLEDDEARDQQLYKHWKRYLDSTAAKLSAEASGTTAPGSANVLQLRVAGDGVIDT